MCRTTIRWKCWSPGWRSRPITIRSISPIPADAHIAEVEIDPETGIVTLVNYTAVDDVGTVINPMIVEGQLHGGIVQGVGQALFENAVYDDVSGQLLSGSFMDYCMPRADHLPNMTIKTHSTLCTHTPMGVKGCGEVGTIGSPAAVINAVVDALSHLGVQHVDMPATPNRIWRVIQNARHAARRRVGGGKDEVLCISQAELRSMSCRHCWTASPTACRWPAA